MASRIGPNINIAESARGSENESTPKDQRVPDRTTELSDGPRKGENNEYLPARYKVVREGEALPGQPPVTHEFIVEDR